MIWSQTSGHCPDPSQSPLAGKRIVITRPEDRADTLVDHLRHLGAEPVVYPTIAFVPPEDTAPLDAALQQLAAGAYDWLVLSSVTGVHMVHQRLSALHIDLRNAIARIAAVGPVTAEECRDFLGVQPAVVPEKFVGEALAEALGDTNGLRILLANADIARPALEERLREAGAQVERAIAYRTVPATGGDVDLPGLLASGVIDFITFTSGSTVRNFLDRIGPDAAKHMHRTAIACIGPITAKVVEELGMTPAVVAEQYTEEGLVGALVAYAQRDQ